MHTKRWQTSFQRSKFTIIAQSYIINIMSVNSWKPVLKQICGEKTFQELRMLPTVTGHYECLYIGPDLGAIAEFLYYSNHHPPPPNSFVILVLVHMPPGHLLRNIVWYIRPIFRTFAAPFFFRCGSISSTFPVGQKFFFTFWLFLILFIASFCNISSVKYVKRYSLKLQTCASISSPLWGEIIYWPQLVSIVAPVWSKRFNWKGTRWCTLHWSNS